MAVALSGGKVLIHQPFHSKTSQEGPTLEFKFLSTNRDIVALESGQLNPDQPEEILFIGSKTSLLAYDVNNNADIFENELADGLNCLGFGKVEGVEEPLIIAGGNCSITGIDFFAEERFWTVTGDNA
jgi:Bardet-Biedl syndrome 2 protein